MESFHKISFIGIENAGMELKKIPISRAIAIPFTPTIACRINFNDISLESLTPCSMLANKLKFTPGPPPAREQTTTDVTPKKSANELSLITEEAAVDINEELDCYQLELENSINEAKAIKKGRRSSGRKKNLMDLKNSRHDFAFRLSQAAEESDNDSTDEEREVENEDYLKQLTPKCDNNVVAEEIKIVQASEEKSINDLDIEFEEILETSDDEFQFKNPAPFVRTFRRKSTRISKIVAKPATETNVRLNANKVATSGIRNSIRKSFRKLINPKRTNSSENLNIESGTEDESSSKNIFSSIRQSFRRKTSKLPMPDASKGYAPLDVSIFVDGDHSRKIYKQNITDEKNRIISDDDLNTIPLKKSSLRSSFRNTTKDVRRQVPTL